MQPVKSSDPAVAWKLIAYFAAVMVGAAILTPLLFWAGKSFADSVDSSSGSTLGWLSSALRRGELSRYFNRAALIAALVLVYPMVRWAGFNRSLFPEWSPAASGLRHCIVGFAAAATLLLLLGWGLIGGGAYKLKPEPSWTSVGSALVAAFSVGFIEEIHFLKPPESFVLLPESVTWMSGFALIGQILKSFSNLNFLLAEFLTLFAVGWVLAQASIKTGRLWVSIGLHAGWVFGLKYFSALTFSTRALKHGDMLPWIGTNLKVGLLPLVVVLVTGWLVLRLTTQKDQVELANRKIRLQEAEPRET